jgi:hypothetical protein
MDMARGTYQLKERALTQALAQATGKAMVREVSAGGQDGRLVLCAGHAVPCPTACLRAMPTRAHPWLCQGGFPTTAWHMFTASPSLLPVA